MLLHKTCCSVAIGAVLALPAMADTVVPPVIAAAGSDFTVLFNGIGGDPVTVQPGLTSSVRFYNFSFNPGSGTQVIDGLTYDFSGMTNVTFDMEITNTSTAPITNARISGLALITSPNIVSSLDSQELRPNGQPEGSIDPNSVTTTFTNVSYGSNFPNGIGGTEFCFSASNNCPGGGGGGTTTSGMVSANLWFATGSLTSLQFDNLYVRYQSVDGCVSCQGSATGVPVLPNQPVPEPSFYSTLAAGVAGAFWLAASRRRRRIN